MSFDRNDPAHLALLKSEVEVDPIGMGYAAVVDTTAQLLKLFNESGNNVGNGSVGQETLANRVFDESAMMDALEPTDFDAQQTIADAAVYTQTLVAMTVVGHDIEPYKTKWRDMFAANSDTVTALDAQTQALSRVEIPSLFGVGTVISREDWFAARDS